jgi:hypothetical protein
MWWNDDVRVYNWRYLQYKRPEMNEQKIECDGSGESVGPNGMR